MHDIGFLLIERMLKLYDGRLNKFADNDILRNKITREIRLKVGMLEMEVELKIEACLRNCFEKHLRIYNEKRT